ncbi:dihydrolipoamide acetyltransferase family protein [Alkalibaculum bacchi]|uniref:dihydrolipoamide acetyltransferase family protein n=1 Tax=Alkalibaculum bacchi TaxID=645887 RepID=UPI0026EF68CE|nr:dihydrolipoamide acetyltransferase family protein [Alkalibaculum bacchi]
MATEIIMPKAGMDMEEGTVIKWLKNVGETVETGEPLLEILTDKVNMEVEAEVSGTLIDIRANEGDVLPVFTVIGYIGEAGEKAPSGEATPSMEVKEVETIEETVKEEKATSNSSIPVGKVRATPAARKIAKDRNLLVEDIPGSGPFGRVQKVDVEEFDIIKATPLATKMAEVENIDLSTIKGTGVGGKITKDDLSLAPTEATGQKKVLAPSKAEEKASNIIPMVGLRKIIAQRMKESLEKSAPVTLQTEVDMTHINALRAKLKPIIQKEIDKKITVTDLLIMATSKALMKYPIVNSTLVEEGIRVNDYVNMGIAVGLENGLLVPVIKGTNKMTLKEIVSSRTDIVKRTLSSKITPDELSGSTFTISNLGMYDTISFNSIINQPNSAILSVGVTVKRMRIINDAPQIREVMNMSITLDHRVMDGLVGAQFLQYLKDLLEDPNLLLL